MLVRGFDAVLVPVWEPAQRSLWRARRLWFVTRVKAKARVGWAQIDVDVAPDVRLGRRINVDIQPWTRNSLVIGAQTVVGDDVVLHFMGGRIAIGRRTIVRKGVWADSAGELHIGNGAFIGYGSFLHCAVSTTVEDLATLAEHVTVTDSAHVRTPEDVPAFWHVEASATSVGRNSWLGAHAVVTAGVRVGQCAFVGANATVTEDVPDGWLAAGNPAKVIRRLEVVEPGA